MKAKFGCIIPVLLLAGVALFSSGCASVAVVGKAKGKFPDRRFATSPRVSAETLPNGDLQLLSRKQSKQDKTAIDFILLVSSEDIVRFRAKNPPRKFASLKASRRETWQPGGTPVPVMVLQYRERPQDHFVRAGAGGDDDGGAMLFVSPVGKARPENERPVNVEVWYSAPNAEGRRGFARIGALPAPAPGYYALLPLSVPFDLVTSPLQVAAFIAVAIVAH
jgi:hypothetical protein